MLNEEQFHCSICLGLFTDPVTIPCGHTFCKACLSSRWDKDETSQCPICRKSLHSRPEVSTNFVMQEISVQIKRRKLSVPGCSADVAEGDVACDVCTDSWQKALKSCLVCLTSYCESHLEPHQIVTTLKVHKLIDPVRNLEDRICRRHRRPLEMFCRDDKTCICVECLETDHNGHRNVLIKKEGERQKAKAFLGKLPFLEVAKLSSAQMKVQKLIEMRQQKMEQIKHSVTLSKVNSDKELAESQKLLSRLICSIQERQAKLQDTIEGRQKAAEKSVDQYNKDLEREISELQRMSTELDKLSHTEDHLHLIQTFRPLVSAPRLTFWSEVHVHTDLCVGLMRRAISELKAQITRELKDFTEIEFARILEYKGETITMDATTANCWLRISEEGTRVQFAKDAQTVSDNPKRFTHHPVVLGKQRFNSGRHYWEVQVGAYGRWDVGVVTETVQRKTAVETDTAHGFFALSKSGFQQYEALSSPPTLLHLNPKPGRIGIYLDYEKGQISFYELIQRTHIYSFFESFSETLKPYFYIHSKARKRESLTICSHSLSNATFRWCPIK